MNRASLPYRGFPFATLVSRGADRIAVVGSPQAAENQATRQR